VQLSMVRDRGIFSTHLYGIENRIWGIDFWRHFRSIEPSSCRFRLYGVVINWRMLAVPQKFAIQAKHEFRTNKKIRACLV
jgi:hypothetical protein